MSSYYPYAGEVVAPDGLFVLEPFLARCPWPIRVVRSGYDSSLYLRARHDDVDLDMDSGQQHRFAFYGAVRGTSEHAHLRIAQLSESLRLAGIVHAIELYEEPPGSTAHEIAYFHHEWPKTNEPNVA